MRLGSNGAALLCLDRLRLRPKTVTLDQETTAYSAVVSWEVVSSSPSTHIDVITTHFAPAQRSPQTVTSKVSTGVSKSLYQARPRTVALSKNNSDGGAILCLDRVQLLP